MALTETANVGIAVATRVGQNIREMRIKLGQTQAQLAAPEFSISYISAIERGKIRPSLKALSILARRLDVPLTFLLEGSPASVKEAQAVGYSPADPVQNQQIDIDLLQTSVLALGLQECQGAVADLRAALTQDEGLSDVEYVNRSRNLLGKVCFLLYNYTLATENHQRYYNAIENGQILDLVFSLKTYSDLANDSFRHGGFGKAASLYQRALETLEGIGRDAKSFARKYIEIGKTTRRWGNWRLLVST